MMTNRANSEGSASDDGSLEIARSAYGDMLHDTERNVLYERGIKWAIDTMRARGIQRVIVLDLGTGSGLLSMLAARHGAHTIYACDAFRQVVEVARRVIDSNGFQDRIKLIPKPSFDVTVGPDQDMETKAHILVSELFDTELVGEGAIQAYEDACARLLDEDCLVVPQDATVYVQIVNSEFLRHHHALNTFGLTATCEIEECLGTASLHDIQLSQLQPGKDLEFVTDPIKAFHFEFKNVLDTASQYSVKLPEAKLDESVCVLMWWECTMCPNVVLSCAPFWAHPDGENQAWRDHWMQAVYYPRKTRGQFLSCSRDEFSFWFDLTQSAGECVAMPVCTCGIHFTTPRSRIAQLGDNLYIDLLKDILESTDESDVLFVGQSSFSLPLVLARRIPDKVLHILDTGTRSAKIVRELLNLNKIENCRLYEKAESVKLVFAEPYFNDSLLPWEHWFRLESFLQSETELKSLNRLPSNLRIMYMCVELENLWKIRAPIKSTVGLDMTAYDEFIQLAISSCDSDVEPQPLWEYPCVSKSSPQLLVTNPTKGQTVDLIRPVESNGIALWAEFDFNTVLISTGPQEKPQMNEKVVWNRYCKQGIIIDVNRNSNYSLTL